MLSKEVLRDMADCMEFGTACTKQTANGWILCKARNEIEKCGFQVCTVAAAKTALALLDQNERRGKMLRKLEFCGYDIDGIGSDIIPGCCPVCWERGKHTPSCELAKLLEGVKEE